MKPTWLPISNASYAREYLNMGLSPYHESLTLPLRQKVAATSQFAVLTYDLIDWSDSLRFQYAPPYAGGQTLNAAGRRHGLIRSGTTQRRFVDFLHQHLRQLRNAVVLSTNWTDSPELYPRKAMQESRVFFDSNWVYYYLQGPHISLEKIDQFLVESSQLDALYVVSSLNGHYAALTSDHLGEIGQNASHLLQIIFDDEGYLHARLLPESS